MKTRTDAIRPLALVATIVALGSLGVLLAIGGGSQAAGAGAFDTTPTTPPGVRPAPVVYRPANLSSATKVPLVIALHGAGSSPSQFVGATLLNPVADRHGFVVAYLGSTMPLWYDPSNITYIGSMITQLTASENIDPERVYVVGFSIGGYATFRSGCDLSSQVTAIAIVSSAMAPLSRKPCNITRPVSELDIAGTSDMFAVHTAPGLSISADGTAADWRGLDGCTSQSNTSQVGPTTQTTWSDCNDGTNVAEYVVNGGTHQWPGSPGRVGADAQYDATQAIWNFFAPLRGSSTSAAAALVSLSVKTGRPRTVRAILSVTESAVQVQATLTVRGRTVVSKTSKLLDGPRNPLVLQVPAATARGVGIVKLVFSDTYGRRLTTVRRVVVPSLPKR